MIKLPAMNKILVVALIFAGFEIHNNSAFQLPKIQDCWDGNKCQLDSHCGKLGVCECDDCVTGLGTGLSSIYHYKLLITPKLI